MIKRFLPLALLTMLALATTSVSSRAQDDDQDVSFQTFYNQLGGDQGTWIQTDDYGYVFQPAAQDPNWAPYTDGHWVYTEDGWTWVSDEPWGWATYHYGRWADLDGIGWVWIPGYQWAPAWVSWRYGHGYCGWAPLPPGRGYGRGGRGGGGRFGSNVDATLHIGSGHYNFVRTNQLGAANVRGVIMNRANNSMVFNNTKNITSIKTSGRNGRGAAFGGVKAGGPPLAAVNAGAAHKVTTMHLTAVGGPGRATAQGNSLSIYAPRVNAATAKQGKPASVGRTISHPKINGETATANPNVRTATPEVVHQPQAEHHAAGIGGASSQAAPANKPEGFAPSSHAVEHQSQSQPHASQGGGEKPANHTRPARPESHRAGNPKPAQHAGKPAGKPAAKGDDRDQKK